MYRDDYQVTGRGEPRDLWCPEYRPRNPPRIQPPTPILLCHRCRTIHDPTACDTGDDCLVSGCDGHLMYFP